MSPQCYCIECHSILCKYTNHTSLTSLSLIPHTYKHNIQLTVPLATFIKLKRVRISWKGYSWFRNTWLLLSFEVDKKIFPDDAILIEEKHSVMSIQVLDCNRAKCKMCPLLAISKKQKHINSTNNHPLKWLTNNNNFRIKLVMEVLNLAHSIIQKQSQRR